MRFREKGATVKAHELTRCIEAANGEKLALCGDWLVVRQNGERVIIDSGTFKTHFEPLGGPNPLLTNQQPEQP